MITIIHPIPNEQLIARLGKYVRSKSRLIPFYLLNFEDGYHSLASDIFQVHSILYGGVTIVWSISIMKRRLTYLIIDLPPKATQNVEGNGWPDLLSTASLILVMTVPTAFSRFNRVVECLAYGTSSIEWVIKQHIYSPVALNLEY